MTNGHPDHQRTILERFQEGDKLLRTGKADEARELLESCLTLASETETVILIDLFSEIVLTTGFCYAQNMQWGKAIEHYRLAETVLKQEREWFTALPEGVNIGIPEDFDNRLALSNVYMSMGLAYDNSFRAEQAMPLYQQALDIQTKIGDRQGAVNIWTYIGVGAQRRQEWEALYEAGEKMLALTHEIYSVDGKITALKFLVQACVNLQREEILDYLEQLVPLEELIEHPHLEDDRAMLKDFQDYFNKQD